MIISDSCVSLDFFFQKVKVKACQNRKLGSVAVSDLLVEGTSGFVHSLKPQEVNLP